MDEFIQSIEWTGLLNRAKELNLKLSIINDVITIEKFNPDGHSVHSMQPRWEVFEKHYWVTIIFKHMDVLAGVVVAEKTR